MDGVDEKVETVLGDQLSQLVRMKEIRGVWDI